jgi:hypothetical protein
MSDVQKGTDAATVAAGLSDAESAAMLSLAHWKRDRDAVCVKTDWRVEIGLRKKGLIGWPRSGDNAYWMTDLGVQVRDLLEASK